jgi:acyl carrier protein phosphodiesterase
MNYLGHLYFSDDDIELMYYNILGDFVKGSNFEKFTVKEIEGIKLHRNIDQYIDEHRVVLELLHTLYDDLPKIAGIAVDLYFDHLLAKNWKDLHQEQLDVFIDKFYSFEFDPRKYNIPMFELVLSRMKQHDWLGSYENKEGLKRACAGLSKRISFKNDLWRAPEVFDKYEPEIQNAFFAFMKEAKVYFQSYHQRH